MAHTSLFSKFKKTAQSISRYTYLTLLPFLIGKLYPHQKDVFDIFDTLENQNAVIPVLSPRQRGKSLLLAFLIVSQLFKHLGTHSIVISPSFSQSKKLFKDVTRIFKGVGLRYYKGDLRIALDEDTDIIFRSALQLDRLRGETVTGSLFVDEAVFVNEECFGILLPFTTKHRANLYMFSTPRFRDGFFYNAFTASPYAVNWSTYNPTPDYWDAFITDDQKAEYAKLLPPQQYRSEILGEFIDGNSLVFGDIDACIKPIVPSKEVVIGIDWGTGESVTQGKQECEGDYTVVTTIDSKGQVIDILRFNNGTSPQQVKRVADKIKSLSRTYEVVSIVSETNSIGTPLTHSLKQALGNLSYKVKGVCWTNETKVKEVNDLICAFSNQDITIPNHPDLIKELSYYQMEKTKTGFTYNAPQGKHDDLIASLCHAWWAYNHPAKYCIKV